MQTQQAQLNAGMFRAGHALWMDKFCGQLGPAHAAINVTNREHFTGVTFGNPGADTFTCLGEKGQLAAFIQITSMQGDRTTGFLDKSSDTPVSFVVHRLTASDAINGRIAVAEWLGQFGQTPVDHFPTPTASDSMMLSDFRPRVLTAVIGGAVLAAKVPNVGLVLTAAKRGAFNTSNYFARPAMPYRLGPGRPFNVGSVEFKESNGWFEKTSF